MKKVLFFAIAAAAALTACSKSEVIDSKYGNDQIGFQTYLGRDAQTKGDVIELEDLTSAKVYGYYTGTDPWSDATTANLWTNGLKLTFTNGVLNDLEEAYKRYWANSTDKYTFLAYAPINNDNLAEPSSTNPTLTYVVDDDFSKHVDVLRADPVIDTTKEKLNGAVPLIFRHTLARLTVKANVNAATPFEFHIKSITLSGNFNTEGTLSLANTDDWTVTKTEQKEYSFYTNPAKANEEGATKLTEEVIDYADGDKGYMMMIPTEFSKDNKATLKVIYTTYFAGLESRPYEVEYDIETGFKAGLAYAFNLAFQQAENNEIEFSVKVEPWDEQEDTKIEIK